MTISYVQGNNPYWYFSDLTGKPAGGGEVWFKDSLNPDNLKTVYQTPDNSTPYPNPIPISLNGTIPPIFFAIDSSALTDGYDIFSYDAQGNLIEQVNGYFPAAGGGGGSPTLIYNLENLVTNNVMYRNTGIAPISPGSGVTILAPGVHQGLAATASNFGPDVCFVKNNAQATDAITFTPFSLGTLFPTTTDTTPYDYFTLACTNAGSSETVKCVQFPLTNKVQNLSNQTISGTIWAMCTSGNNALSLSIVQFFGDGSSASNPSATGNTVTTILTPMGGLSLTDGWVQYYYQAQTIPSVASGTAGQCGNDGVFLQVGLPLNETTNISFTKPTLYLGSNYSFNNYESYDKISGIVEAPRTGDIRISTNAFAPYGWVVMNNQTIGSDSSGATTAALNTFPLFNLLWTAITSQANGTNAGGTGYAQLYSSAGAVQATVGASAVADFSANKRIRLTEQLGNAIAGVGAGFSLGQYTGSATHTIAANELPQHTHDDAGQGAFIYNSGSTGIYTIGPSGTALTQTGGISGYTSTTAIPIIQPTVFYNVLMKL